MYGKHYQLIMYLHASSVNVFKSRIDKYLVKRVTLTHSIRAGYT